MVTPVVTAGPTSTPEPPPARVLTVCLGQEPESLFLYGDSSVAARSVREAIYDGPFDTLGFEIRPVILEKAPGVDGGDVLVEPIQVQVGDLIVDSNGNLANLDEGVTFLPAGCSDISCSQTYTGGQPATIGQVVVRYKLLPGLLWSDGTPLTAADSLYSYEVAKSLFSGVQSDRVGYTASYQVVDELTAEWRGVPGYKDIDYSAYFFSPLPKHIWGTLTPADLLEAEISSRTPIGWGPYIIEEWTSGDHITLGKNPHYFRAEEGVPAFDQLVFRFVSEGEEAVNALLAGECDFLDTTALSYAQRESLLQYQEEGRLAVAIENGNAWEHADFGIAPADAQIPTLFGVKEVRQAVAMCIDRQSIAQTLFAESAQVPNTYLPSFHPLYAPGAKAYIYDPGAAAALLDAAGWRDADGNPATPRVASGVPGVPEGTEFRFTYLTIPGGERNMVAEQLQTSLAGCGIEMEVSFTDAGQLFSPGPEGQVFGRQFDMVQFGWTTSLKPPCFLYTSGEVPGPYPEFPKGWGGANASGYMSPEFDQACLVARSILPGTTDYKAAHHRAQEIFAEELPAIPLYLHQVLAAMRTDMCGVVLDPAADSALWNLEMFNYGENCGE